MNLYRTIFRHHSQKDSQTGTICLLLANSDEEVYEFLKKEPEINGEKYFVSWADREEEGETKDIEDEDYNVIGSETSKEYLIRIKGDMNDEDWDYCDLYYGLTLVGWELISEDTKIKYDELIRLGQVFRSDELIKSLT